MRFEIAKTVPDTARVKTICREIAKLAHVSTSGLLVHVEVNRGRMMHNGKFFNAICVYRQGKRVPVKGYIKLWFRYWNQIAATFAHELSHLREARKYGQLPRGCESRAEVFAERIMGRYESLKRGEGVNDHS